jgi:hypothetical protein
VTPRREHELFLHELFFTWCLVLSAMDDKIEQRVCVKFFGELGKSDTETLELLRETSGQHSLSRTTVFKLPSLLLKLWMNLKLE